MAGLPSGSVNEIIEHPDALNVLFLGTEHHLFVSTDAGAHWAGWPGMPTTLYDDLLIHPREKDLVIGTHGRAIWILDDTRPLTEWNADVAAAPVHLFTVRQATIFTYWKDTSYRAQAAFAGENPLDGAIITYKLGPGSGEALLRVTNSEERVIREYRVPTGEGLHRVNWDLRYPSPPDTTPERWVPFQDAQLPRSVEDRGHFVSPGSYTLTLEARGRSVSTTLTVRGDPEMPHTQAQYEERESFLNEVVALQEEFNQVLGSAQAFGFGGRREDPDATPQERALQQHRRQLTGVYNSLNGSGVRQGSLYPPTQTQRAIVQSAREALREYRR
jgi:hypothetical protein